MSVIPDLDMLLRITAAPLAQAIGWALLQFVWQGALIGALAAVALAALRRSAPDVRYVVATIALSLMLTVPVVSAWQTFTASLGPTGAAAHVESTVSRTVPAPRVPPTGRQAGRNLAVAAMADDVAVTRSVALQSRTAAAPDGRRFDWLARWLLIGWTVGVLALTLRLLSGWLWVQRLRTHGTTEARTMLRDATVRLARRLHISRTVRLMESALVEVPTVIGWMRPVILLPAGALSGLTPMQIEALLAHELAHIRRHDYLVNLLQTLVETLLFYHPAVWWVSRQIRIERENCCDDLAVNLCGDPVAYARALADLEQLRGPARRLSMAANGGSLLDRVRRLLCAPSHAGTGAGWLAGGVSIVVIVAMAGIAAGAIGHGGRQVSQQDQRIDMDRQATGTTRAVLNQVRRGANEVRDGADELRRAADELRRGADDVRRAADDVRRGADAFRRHIDDVRRDAEDLSRRAPEALARAVHETAREISDGWRRTQRAFAMALHDAVPQIPPPPPLPPALPRQPRRVPAPEPPPPPPAAPLDAEPPAIDADAFLQPPLPPPPALGAAPPLPPLPAPPAYALPPPGVAPPPSAPPASPPALQPPAIVPPAPPLPGVPRRRDQRGNFTWSKDGQKLQVDYRGEVEFTDDDQDVKSLSPGGYLRIEERAKDARRAVEFRADDSGRIGRRFWLGASERPFDPEGRKWLSQVLPRFIRQTGIGAAARVARILESKGAQGVLAEISLVEGSWAKRIYFAELLKTAGLDSRTVVQALAQAGREIDSDFELASLLMSADRLLTLDDASRKAYFEAARTIQSDFELRRVLSAALKEGPMPPALLADLLATSAAIESDFEQASLLVDVAKLQPIDGTTRAPFFKAFATIDSDFEQRRVLADVLRREGQSPTATASVLEFAGTIGSDFELASLLADVVKANPIEGDLRQPFFRALSTVGSTFERGRVLQALAKRPEVSDQTILEIIKATAGMGHFEAAQVLLAVAGSHPLTRDARDAYLDAAERLGDFEQGRVLAALVKNERRR